MHALRTLTRALCPNARAASLGQYSSYHTLFVQPDDKMPEYTTIELLENFVQLTGGPQTFFSGIEANEHRRKLMEFVPKHRSELPPRRMQDSFASVKMPLKSDKIMRERYTQAHGHLRIGRLLEELDLFAAHCCYNHIIHPKSSHMPKPYSCVTVLVDNIFFSTNSIRTDEDVRISGHVSWVGKSSVEISILVDQPDGNGNWKKITDAIFVFVARDPMNQGSVMVNELIAETPAEKAYIDEGEERNRRRREVSQRSLVASPPTEEESQVIHSLCAKNIKSDSHLVSGVIKNAGTDRMMSDWTITTLLLCHPQYRNRFNKIFGGFIMRQAYEIAHSTTYLYSGARPKIVFVDDILFRKPVEIGSLVKYSASVGYVEGKYIHIPVAAEVLTPETGQKSLTNIFHFTFLSQSENDPPPIKPESYIDSIRYLYARRHFIEMRSQYSDA